MKLKALVLTMGSFFAAAAVADVNTQIQQLQQQITQLQSQINTVSSNGNLSMLSQEVNKDAFTDYNDPLGELPDTGLSYALLQQQDQFKSILTLGGYIEADAQYWGGNTLVPSSVIGSYPNRGTDVALTTADLYLLGNINNWTQAFMTVKGGLNGNSTTVSEAFLNFGNLSKNPLYATFGKTYIPFGIFNGNGPYANNLLTNAFRSNQIAQAIFGFGQGGLNTSLAFFNGQNNFGDFSYNLQYGTTLGNVAISTGAAYMNDVRYTGSDLGAAYANNGTATSSTTPLTGGRNGAVDINGQVTYNFSSVQSVGLNGEWITTTNSPYVGNTAMGKMKAWNVTANYTLPILTKSTTFGLGYSATQNMENVPLNLNGNAQNGPGATIIGAQGQWLLYGVSEVYNNIYLGPEFSRMKMYNGTYTWESTVDLSVYF